MEELLHKCSILPLHKLPELKLSIMSSNGDIKIKEQLLNVIDARLTVSGALKDAIVETAEFELEN